MAANLLSIGSSFFYILGIYRVYSITLFEQYYSAICRRSDRTVGRPRGPGPRFEPEVCNLIV